MQIDANMFINKVKMAPKGWITIDPFSCVVHKVQEKNGDVSVYQGPDPLEKSDVEYRAFLQELTDTFMLDGVNVHVLTWN